jgi:hypothetical protein
VQLPQLSLSIAAIFRQVRIGGKRIIFRQAIFLVILYQHAFVDCADPRMYLKRPGMIDLLLLQLIEKWLAEMIQFGAKLGNIY